MKLDPCYICDEEITKEERAVDLLSVGRVHLLCAAAAADAAGKVLMILPDDAACRGVELASNHPWPRP